MKALIAAVGAVLLMGAVCPAMAQTTAEMYGEASRDFQAADKQLNAAYKELMKVLDDEGKKRLQVAQRAWLDFRDKQAGFLAVSSAGGTMEKLEYISAQTVLTQERTVELKEAIKIFK